MAAKESGGVLDFPVIDLTCTLIDGGYHEVDSSDHTFEIAARACFREATPKAHPRLIEPIMHVMVLTPEDHIGAVVSDLNSRCGVVRSLDARGFVVVDDEWLRPAHGDLRPLRNHAADVRPR